MLVVGSGVHFNILLAEAPTFSSNSTIVKNTSSSKSSTVDLAVVKKDNPVTKIAGIVFIGLSFVATVMPAAMAETFSIDGMALNTNNNFPLKDGQPIMSTWKLNPSDNDQQFDRQGQLLRHRSTGKCLNAYQPSVGSIVNVYPCNSNDGDQKFAILSTGGNVNLIQRIGTNLCLDMDSRNQNTRMKLWNCSANFPNQRFVSNASQSNSTSANPAPAAPTPQASNPDISIRLSFNGNFTTSQRTAIQKAAQNWESIITRDMVPGGILNVNVVDGSMQPGPEHWAETLFPNLRPGQIATPRQRSNLSGQYNTTMKISRSFLNGSNSYQLTKLATHELGHALYLDEGVNDSLLRLNGYGIMEIYPLNPTINEGVYRRLESLGYSVNRNPSLQW
jgi:Ricin-type beta-trefoil lectin domain